MTPSRTFIRTFWALALVSGANFAHADLGELFRSARDAAQLARQAGGAVQDVASVMRSVESVTKVSTAPVPQDAVLPPVNADGKVVIYTRQTCGYCKAAIKHMQGKNIAYLEKDVQANESYADEFVKMKARGVPQILFGAQVMSGWEARDFDRLYASWKAAPVAPAAGSRAGDAASSSSPGAISASTSASPAAAMDLGRTGDVLLTRIRGVKLASSTSKESTAVAVLDKGEELVYLGEQREGQAKVGSARGEGWVPVSLVRKP